MTLKKLEEEKVMKKVFSLVLGLVMAIIISGQASAANWEVVDAGKEENGIKIVTLVDKDSIRRGTESQKFAKYNRKDGFSAIVKLEIKVRGQEEVELINLVSFYEEKSERMYCMLDDCANSADDRKESDIIIENVDKDGEVWKTVWSYIESNL